MPEETYTKLYDWILELNDLDISNKVLLAKVIELDALPRGCFMSNRRIGQLLGVTSKSASRRVQTLVDCGYISITVDGRNHRHIKFTGKKVGSPVSTPIPTNEDTLSPSTTIPIPTNEDTLSPSVSIPYPHERGHNRQVEHTNENKMEHTNGTYNLNIPHYEMDLLLQSIKENITHERAKDLILRKLAGEDFTPTMVEEFTKYYGMYFTINKLKEIITNENSTGT